MPKTLSQKLKALYKIQNTLPKLIDDASIPTQKLDDYYVQLKMLLNEGNTEARPNIELKKIFAEIHDKPQANKVLIVGDAGTGKSTFLQNIAYQWGRGELYNDKFDYVFKVKLKYLAK
jgi:predicted NACHT family NTPase